MHQVQHFPSSITTLLFHFNNPSATLFPKEATPTLAFHIAQQNSKITNIGNVLVIRGYITCLHHSNDIMSSTISYY